MLNDSARLLGECDAGIQMAISAIDEVLPSVNDPHLRKTLHMSRRAHKDLRNRTQNLLRACHAPGKDPNPMAKSMSWLKTNARLAFKPGDASVADLVVSGCNMGIKNLHKYQNQYASADEPSKNVADELIGLEADLANSLYPYL